MFNHQVREFAPVDQRPDTVTAKTIESQHDDQVSLGGSWCRSTTDSERADVPLIWKSGAASISRRLTSARSVSLKIPVTAQAVMRRRSNQLVAGAAEEYRTEADFPAREAEDDERNRPAPLRRQA